MKDKSDWAIKIVNAEVPEYLGIIAEIQDDAIRSCPPCPRCNGNGWYAVSVGDGVGSEQEQCERCQGTGHVTACLERYEDPAAVKIIHERDDQIHALKIAIKNLEKQVNELESKPAARTWLSQQ